jgi:homoserine dehydrogenase
MHLRLALVGCGKVGRALLAMLAEKEAALRERNGLTLSITGGMTRSSGGWILPAGVRASDLAATGWPKGSAPAGSRPFAGYAARFAAECPADVDVELTTLNPRTGQPALDTIRAALGAGHHVVTANKRPIAHAYRELRELAEAHGVALRFESTVMDGTPVFGMVEACLPATEIRGFRGTLNSTSNYVLSQMARGDKLELALASARRLGIAEADPSNDLDGWDAAVKATVLANVLMEADLRPQDVVREGLGAEAMRRAQETLELGHVLKQLAEARREASGVVARVTLTSLPLSDLMASTGPGETALRLSTDTMGELTLVEGDGGPGQTAFGIIADLVAIARRTALSGEEPCGYHTTG